MRLQNSQSTARTAVVGGATPRRRRAFCPLKSKSFAPRSGLPLKGQAFARGRGLTTKGRPLPESEASQNSQSTARTAVVGGATPRRMRAFCPLKSKSFAPRSGLPLKGQAFARGRGSHYKGQTFARERGLTEQPKHRSHSCCRRRDPAPKADVQPAQEQKLRPGVGAPTAKGRRLPEVGAPTARLGFCPRSGLPQQRADLCPRSRPHRTAKAPLAQLL